MNWFDVPHNAPIRQVRHFAEITSTNDIATEWIRNEATSDLDPVLFVADRQNAGRGRGNHQWWSPSGSLAITLAITWNRLHVDRSDSARLSSHIAKSLADTVDHTLSLYLEEPPVAEIKFPNDILLNRRKLAGILIESPNPLWVAIGIGVNLNTDVSNSPPEIFQKIISISQLCHQNIDPVKFTVFLLKKIITY